MAHSQSFEAIVLKTYDVGEADRFCILFTRERGRIAARASGARRPTSRLGGALLPFRHVKAELKECSAGWIVAGVARENRQNALKNASLTRRENTHMSVEAITTFTALEEGIELLLRLVTDEGALPEIFDSTLAFIDACHDGVSLASLGYGFALLHHLGLLPGDDELGDFSAIGMHERAYLRSSLAGIFDDPHPECDLNKLMTLKSALLDDHLTTPMKAPEIAAAMA
ncbi:recombination protein O N-terminal domain-containing protein [Candidatus Peregrinibacteria bacterium]|nr:recombination protein O N-terminal domain-containing protein [Candidatus Peregrinibacteria bacterium]